LEGLSCSLLAVVQSEQNKPALRSQNLPECLSQYSDFAAGMIPGREVKRVPSP